MRKKVIKAHQGMAHVPKPSGQQAPSKAKGTAGTTPRPKRMIGLPQRFRGGSRRASNLPQLSKDQQQALKRVQQAAAGLKKGINPKDIKSQLTPKQIKAQADAYKRQVAHQKDDFRPSNLQGAIDPRVANYTDNFRPRKTTAPAPKAPPMVRPTQAVPEPAIVKKPKPVREPVRDSCPSPDTLINLSNNETKQAGDLAVGDTVYTQHENTLEWGDYTVSHVSIVPNSERIQLVFDTTKIVCSLSHKMYVFNKGWTKAKDIEIDDIVSGHTLKDKVEWEAGDVVKITIEEAHSYIAAGLLSHNKRYASPVQQKPKPKPQSFRVPASRAPKVIPKPMPTSQLVKDAKRKFNQYNAQQSARNAFRTINKGGYISRAKYGIVDNLKGK